MSCDQSPDTTSDMTTAMGALRGQRWKTVRLSVRGRDGGEGSMVVSSRDSSAVSVVGQYVQADGTVAHIDIVRRGDMFVDTASGRVSDTAEALLPLAVRDAPWDVA